MAEEAARRVAAELPLLRTAAGPRDREGWAPRLKEEYRALIQYVENNKRADNDWFRLESNAEGTRWSGRCWYIHELLKYEFALEFDIPVTYPATAPEIAIPELDGKTAKMYSWAPGWPWRSPTSSPKASSSTRRSERLGEGAHTHPAPAAPAASLLPLNKRFSPGLAPACCSGAPGEGAAPPPSARRRPTGTLYRRTLSL
ncbi:ubiquitin-fold modifier-conjugating enzyme 1 isoform X1 [Strix uralensis]|uniref:ubiquitin-fold modifier-conjugating enzyme 1 isoform X1 n=1 Tax=Strix uralensis TaxID=36305 RepID=UPI003DA73F5A